MFQVLCVGEDWMPFPNDNSYFPFGPSPISSRSQFSSSVQLNDHIMATLIKLWASSSPTLRVLLGAAGFCLQCIEMGSWQSSCIHESGDEGRWRSSPCFGGSCWSLLAWSQDPVCQRYDSCQTSKIENQTKYFTSLLLAAALSQNGRIAV